MDNLLPIVNKLQDVFAATGQQNLDLPQIVVIGSQSAGKSSVLENLVGRDFLPRGAGIVTRRPLILHMVTIFPDADEDPDPRGEEWGEFLHLPSQRFYDFGQIRAEIERETDRETGSKKMISSKAISLKIYSPYVLCLSLIDLPGITKVPTGDQPEDIEERIRLLCYDFIANPNAVILAVTPANQDLANSDALKMARSVDPDGLRTIGVLTKVDLMDRGLNCAKILNNEEFKLQKGYVGVVNRSQADINNNVPIREGLQKEMTFFQTHPVYRTMLSRCSTNNLARILNQMLMIHVRQCLPEIRARINSMVMDVQTNLTLLGDSIDDQSTAQKGSQLLHIIKTFVDNFNARVEGRGPTSVSQTKELYGGARIQHIFSEIFAQKLKSLDTFEGLEDADIRTAIANANGIRPSLFVPEISFDLLVRRQITRLESPGLQALDMVRDEIQKMVMDSVSLDLLRFPELHEKALEMTHDLLKSCLPPAQTMISSLIQIELAYINTSHPDFIGGRAAAAAVTQRMQPGDRAGSAHSAHGAAADGASGAGALDSKHVMSVATATAAKTIEIQSPQPTAPAARTGGGFPGLFFQSPGVTGGGGGGAAVVAAAPNTAMNGVAKSAAERPPAAAAAAVKSSMHGDDFSVIRLAPVSESVQPRTAPSDRERVEMEMIKKLISSYFDIVKKNFIDLVPKTIMHFLVLAFKNRLHNHLVSELHKEQYLHTMMKEAEENAAKRRAYREMRDLLSKAIEIVNEVRDFQFTK